MPDVTYELLQGGEKKGEKRKLNVGLGFHSALCSGEHQAGI